MKQLGPPWAQRRAPAGPGLFHIETQDLDLKYGGAWRRDRLRTFELT